MSFRISWLFKLSVEPLVVLATCSVSSSMVTVQSKTRFCFDWLYFASIACFWPPVPIFVDGFGRRVMAQKAQHAHDLILWRRRKARRGTRGAKHIENEARDDSSTRNRDKDLHKHLRAGSAQCQSQRTSDGDKMNMNKNGNGLRPTCTANAGGPILHCGAKGTVTGTGQPLPTMTCTGAPTSDQHGITVP